MFYFTGIHIRRALFGSLTVMVFQERMHGCVNDENFEGQRLNLCLVGSASLNEENKNFAKALVA